MNHKLKKAALNFYNKLITFKEWPILIIFLCFVFTNAVKNIIFYNLLIDLSACNALGSCLFSKFFISFVLYLILTRLKRKYLFIVFYVLQTLYMVINLSYHFSLQGYVHINQYIHLFSETLELIKHSALPFNVKVLYSILDLPFFIATLFVYNKFYQLNKKNLFKPVIYAALILLIIITIKWDVNNFEPKKFIYDAYSSDLFVISKYGILVYNIVDLIKLGDTKKHIKYIKYGPVVSKESSDSINFNVIVIQFESLDAFIINRKYKNKYIAPFLSELSNNSIYYPYALSYHKAGSTSDCEFSVINSIEPFDDMPSIKIRNYEYPNSICKQFCKNGYTVEAFHGNIGTYFNREVALKKMGFSDFYDIRRMQLREVGWGAPDKAVFDFVKTKLMFQGSNFYYHIITMSSHEPFIFVKDIYKNNLFSDIKNEKRKDYYNSISYVDGVLKEFLDYVKTKHPNTYIFIYGDHTPLIQKEDYKKSCFIKNGFMFEFVPLFIITPDSKKYKEKELAISFLDIAITMAEASNISYNFKTHGINLLNYPIKDGFIPYRGNLYSRKDLFKKIKQINYK